MVSPGVCDLRHGGRVCYRCQGLGKQIEAVRLCRSGNRHHLRPVPSILVGSATKASAFTDNLNQFIVISVIMVFNLSFFHHHHLLPTANPLVFPSLCCWGPLPECWGFVWWWSALYKTSFKKRQQVPPSYFPLPPAFFSRLQRVGFTTLIPGCYQESAFVWLFFYILKYSGLLAFSGGGDCFSR